MASFKKHYRAMFRTFGYPLTERTALSSDVLAAAEKRLGAQIPTALRDYYLVAGRERRFNVCHNRLLPPAKWSTDKQRLIFMEENQSVVQWAVSTRKPASDDPPVSQAIMDDEPISLQVEHRKCSVFLAVMLHWQAVSGGLRFCGRADAPEQTSYRFEENGWTYYGEINSQQAYSRPNQVVCVVPPTDLPFMQKWSIRAGGKTKRDLQAIARDLELNIEE